MRDGVAIIFVARTEAIEKFIQPQYALRHFPHSLKSD